MKCPKCKKRRLRQLVHVVVEVDADCRSLSKKGIQRKDARIMGVLWDQASFFCPGGDYHLNLYRLNPVGK